MPQEDVTLPPMPMLVQVLHELQFFAYSVNWNRKKDELHVYPSPPDDIAEKIRGEFPALKYLLPGVCDFCQQWSIRRFEMYWAAHPHACSRCTLLATRLYNRENQWPEVEWDENEAIWPPSP